MEIREEDVDKLHNIVFTLFNTNRAVSYFDRGVWARNIGEAIDFAIKTADKEKMLIRHLRIKRR